MRFIQKSSELPDGHRKTTLDDFEGPWQEVPAEDAGHCPNFQDSKDPRNYRPVSPTSIPGKVVKKGIQGDI